jgi:hypothetical protein
MNRLLTDITKTYGETYVNELKGSQLKEILEGIAENLFVQDPYCIKSFAHSVWIITHCATSCFNHILIVFGVNNTLCFIAKIFPCVTEITQSLSSNIMHSRFFQILSG